MGLPTLTVPTALDRSASVASSGTDTPSLL
jgi:hypothetical protein